MVAPGTLSFSPRPAVPSSRVARMGYGPVRFTFTDALNMVQQGILPEDSTVELIHGELLYRDRFDLRGDEIVEGFNHNYAVGRWNKLAGSVDSPERHIRTQSTLKCSETYAPIPDAAVLRGEWESYTTIATASDVYCVIEVADSSYERDTGEKLEGYARAGIRQYIVINLRNRTAEVYSEPDSSNGAYPPPVVLAPADTLRLRVGEGEEFGVLVESLLPPLKD